MIQTHAVDIKVFTLRIDTAMAEEPRHHVVLLIRLSRIQVLRPRGFSYPPALSVKRCTVVLIVHCASAGSAS